MVFRSSATANEKRGVRGASQGCERRDACKHAPSWIPGRRRYQIGEAHARSLGQMAGALHQHAQTIAAPASDAIKSWDARFMCGMGKKDGLHSFAPEAVELVERVSVCLQRVMATLESHECGLINADLGLHNVLWHEGRAGLVDFNDAGIGPYAFCLARLLARIQSHEKGQGLANDLLSGYREVAPLPAAYVKWGGLFEVAAEVFRLNFSAARVVNRGTTLQAHERRMVTTLSRRVECLDL
jgi:Ser/Thr protein kinase RdoA (MazF antagonist)